MNTTMIDKVDEMHQGNGSSSTMSGNPSPFDPFAESAVLPGACLGPGLCGCNPTQGHCYQPPPASKSERLQHLMDIIDEALLLVSDPNGGQETQRSVDSSEETKAQSISEQEEHPSGADAKARHGSLSTS